MSESGSTPRHYSLISSEALDRPIVLVGMMGAGKSTIGRRLAKRLGIDFVDADAEIERAAGRSIVEIFEELGEDAFRDGERRVMMRLLDSSPQVIASGGGAFLDRQTRDTIKARAISIWLDADLEVLLERTARRDSRPLLRQGDPREILARQAAERRPVYAEAAIHVVSSEGPHRQVVDAILEALDNHIKESWTP